MKKDVYVNLRINSGTAEAFKDFSRNLGKKHSTSLQLMLDFFKHHDLSPLDELDINLITLEKRINTRINAVVAILKEIERTQTRPTHSMLQVLFQESPGKTSELLVEKNTNSPIQKKVEPQITVLKATEPVSETQLSKNFQDI